MQIRDAIGLNFAAALRSFLRQDPNIILVGEIRDYETAEIAVKAALTGHLVLSTLHTNDAPSTVSRLVNMGIEPFLVGTAVNLIQAQRLIRRVCSNCKDELTDVPAQDADRHRLHARRGGHLQALQGPRLRHLQRHRLQGPRRPVRGDGDLRGHPRPDHGRRAPSVEIKRKALEEGMLTLRMSGLEKIKARHHDDRGSAEGDRYI